MNRLKATTKFQVLLVIGLIAVLIFASATNAFMAGITEEQEPGVRAEGPAGCHAPEASGNVQAVLEGVPGNFTTMPGGPDEAYEPRDFNLTLRIDGGPTGDRGGFNLWVSGGTLAPGAGDDDRLRITDEGDEATHTIDGATGRTWNITWTSPENPRDSVIFQLIVNAIDADALPAPSPTDEWNRATVVSAGAGGIEVGTGDTAVVRVEEFGVGWFAYWVGIISFVFLGIVLLVYYVVFRYGETSKATDHRARKGKNK